MKKKEIFEYFIGNWRLNKVLGTMGSAEGMACFKLLDSNKIQYREDLTIKFNHEVKAFDAYRDYLYIYDNKNDIITKKFSDNLEFYTLNFDFAHHTAFGIYTCLADNYKAIYNFKSEGNFSISYIVKGPAKDYTIYNEYTRIVNYDPALIGTFDDSIS